MLFVYMVKSNRHLEHIKLMGTQKESVAGLTIKMQNGRGQIPYMSYFLIMDIQQEM